MRKVFCALFMVVISLSSCKDEESKPADLIPREKMKVVLTDIHLAEVYSTMVNDSSGIRNKNLDSLAYYYKTILAHHDVTFENFKESFYWYRQHPQELDTVYQDMMPIISTYEGTY